MAAKHSCYARWLEETEEFDFVVHHRASVTNSQRADPVLGVVHHALKTRGFNIPTQDNVLHQWQKKRKFLTVGKEDGLLRIRYNIEKRIVNQLVVPQP